MTNWQKVKLENLGEVLTGKTPATKITAYWGNDIPFVTPKDIQSSKHIFITERYLTKDGMSSVKGCILPPKSVCVSCIGNIGYTSMTTEISVSNQQINSIVVNDENDADFVYYLMRSLWGYFKNYEGQSTTLSILNKSHFSKIEVCIPKSKDTQKKIAGVLGVLDDKIELNNKINQNLESQAQALFKSWFIDFEPFGGKMPDDWKVGKLGDLADITMGQSPDGNSYNENNNGCIFFQGRAEFGKRFPRMRLYTTEPRRMARKNDVLMSVRAPVGDFNVALDDCCIGRGLCAIRSKQGFQSFILYTIWSLQAKLDIFNGEGTVFGSINKEALNNLQTTIPTITEIKKFEDKCSLLDKLICNKHEENTRLAQLRDTLLPMLMFGEIDVDNVKID